MTRRSRKQKQDSRPENYGQIGIYKGANIISLCTKNRLTGNLNATASGHLPKDFFPIKQTGDYHCGFFGVLSPNDPYLWSEDEINVNDHYLIKIKDIWFMILAENENIYEVAGLIPPEFEPPNEYLINPVQKGDWLWEGAVTKSTDCKFWKCHFDKSEKKPPIEGEYISLDGSFYDYRVDFQWIHNAEVTLKTIEDSFPKELLPDEHRCVGIDRYQFKISLDNPHLKLDRDYVLALYKGYFLDRVLFNDDGYSKVRLPSKEVVLPNDFLGDRKVIQNPDSSQIIMYREDKDAALLLNSGTYSFWVHKDDPELEIIFPKSSQ